MSSRTVLATSMWLIPEYCAGPFYMGWHLYVRQRNDGSPNDDGDWGWIRRSNLLTFEVSRLLDELGTDHPRMDYGLDSFDQLTRWTALVEWFAEFFPSGLQVCADRPSSPRKLSLVSPGGCS